MYKSEYDEKIKPYENKEFDEYIKDMLDLHLENGYEIKEFNLIVTNEKKIDDLPCEIAFSIVIKHKECGEEK